MNTAKPINIAILAMGGEGGGMLADWLVHVGEQDGYIAQTTSVPGVAQRTGATIYYLELFPKDALPARGSMPVLGLTPMPGDIDLVIASELMEAGRAVQRGLVTPVRTHFVASTHRVYSMAERTALADGRVDGKAIEEGCRAAALKFTGFDMARLAEANQSVISAVLLGATAGSQALPFARAGYEAAIRANGVSVSENLAAFSAGYFAAEGGKATPEPFPPGLQQPEPHFPGIMIDPGISGEARSIIAAGIDRAADYLDRCYAQQYYDQLKPFIAVAQNFGEPGQTLLCETARQLALGMTYEDAIRVAELKIRPARFERVRAEVGATPEQVVEIVEFMHPRIEEIADTMPAWLGRWLIGNRLAKALISKVTSRGWKVQTTSLRGFLLLYFLASLKSTRRSTLRFARESHFLSEWLETVRRAVQQDIGLAIGFAELRNLVKGYGETYDRGLRKYHMIRSFILDNLGDVAATGSLSQLILAAQKDEHGDALAAAIRDIHLGLSRRPPNAPSIAGADRMLTR